MIRDNLTHVSEEKIHYTGLILVSGVDSPGITKALFDTLAPFALTILDIEQVVIRERLILTALISLNPDHAQAIEADLNECADRLSVDIATSFGVQADASIAAKTGLVHVVILARELHPRAIAAVAQVISEEQGNIERIHRTASVPITAIEFTVSGAHSEQLRQSLATVSNEQEIDIAVSPGGLMRWAKKLVVLDMDSTLIQQEVIELLAAHAGAETAVKEITERAMRGELDFT